MQWSPRRGIESPYILTHNPFYRLVGYTIINHYHSLDRIKDQTALSIFTFIKYYTVKIISFCSAIAKKKTNFEKKKVIHLILGIKKKIHIGLQLLMLLQFRIVVVVVVVVVVSLVSVVGSSD